MANDKGQAFDIYTASEYMGKKRWTRIGRMWPRKNGPGFSIRLQSLPFDPNLMVFPVDPRPKDERQQQRQGERVQRPRRAGEVVGETNSQASGPSDFDYGDGDNF